MLIVIEGFGEVDADWIDVAVDFLDCFFERCALQAPVGVAAVVASVFALRTVLVRSTTVTNMPPGLRERRDRSP